MAPRQGLTLLYAAPSSWSRLATGVCGIVHPRLNSVLVSVLDSGFNAVARLGL